MELLNNVTSIFSNREIAIFFWIGLLILVLLINKKVRRSVLDLIKAFLSWKIQVALLIALVYSSAPVLIFNSFGIWEISLLKDAIYWFAGSAFITMMGLNDKMDEDGRFKKMLISEFKLIIIIQFIAAYHQFSLIKELIIVPVLTFFSLLLGVSQTDVKYRPVEKLINGMLAIVGIYFITTSVMDIVEDINGFANYDTLKSFLQPIILAIWFTPFAFLMTIYMRYENIFTRLNIFMKNKKLRRFTKRRILWKGKLNLKKIKELSSAINWIHGKWTKEEIKEVIK